MRHDHRALPDNPGLHVAPGNRAADIALHQTVPDIFGHPPHAWPKDILAKVESTDGNASGGKGGVGVRTDTGDNAPGTSGA